jgi:hypothetical protein
MIPHGRFRGTWPRRGTLLVLAVMLLLLTAIGVAALPSGSSSSAKAATEATGNGELTRQLADDEVLIGAYVQNIQTVDPQTNSFSADIYVWLRWSNEALEPWKTMEFMNLYEAWQLTSWTATEEPERQSDGTLYYLTRYQGAFNSRLALADYPFGTQRLLIEIEDIKSESQSFRYVTNSSSIDISDEISIPGYHIGTPSIAASDYAYSTDFGSLDSTKTNVYSKVLITMPVSYPVLTNAVKYLVPILLVMIAAGLIFQIPPGLVEGRIGLAITALLTLVAMQWTATDGLPINEYLTLLDVLYVLSLAFILGSLIRAIRTSWVARDTGEEAAIRLDERSMIAFFALYAVTFATAVLGYLLI